MISKFLSVRLIGLCKVRTKYFLSMENSCGEKLSFDVIKSRFFVRVSIIIFPTLLIFSFFIFSLSKFSTASFDGVYNLSQIPSTITLFLSSGAFKFFDLKPAST